MEKRFYPKWYKKREEDKYIKKSKKVLAVSFMLIMFILINIITGIKDIEMKKELIQKKNSINAFNPIYTYDYLSKNLESIDEDLKTLYFQEDNIIAEIYINNTDDYFKKIELLENYFNLIEIGTVEEENKEKFFKVEMSMKNESF